MIPQHSDISTFNKKSWQIKILPFTIIFSFNWSDSLIDVWAIINRIINRLAWLEVFQVAHHTTTTTYSSGMRIEAISAAAAVKRENDLQARGTDCRCSSTTASFWNLSQQSSSEYSEKQTQEICNFVRKKTWKFEAFGSNPSPTGNLSEVCLLEFRHFSWTMWYLYTYCPLADKITGRFTVLFSS